MNAREDSMSFRELLLMALAVAAVSGCAVVQRQEIRKAQMAADNTVPTCQGEADCAAKWEAARRWVVNHAGYLIQTSTDELIETDSPRGTDPRLAARVTKEPQDGSVYKILVTVWCGNADSCDTDPAEAALSFNRAVDAATPQRKPGE
jgi:hypothetical protein